MSNYCVKEPFGGEIVKVPIEDDNTFTTCPRCGAEFAIDLADIVDTMGGFDLYGTAVYCAPCSNVMQKEREAGNVVPLRR